MVKVQNNNHPLENFFNSLESIISSYNPNLFKIKLKFSFKIEDISLQ